MNLFVDKNFEFSLKPFSVDSAVAVVVVYGFGQSYLGHRRLVLDVRMKDPDVGRDVGEQGGPEGRPHAQVVLSLVVFQHAYTVLLSPRGAAQP